MLEEKLETIDDFNDEYDALYEEILELKEELEEKVYYPKKSIQHFNKWKQLFSGFFFFEIIYF